MVDAVREIIVHKNTGIYLLCWVLNSQQSHIINNLWYRKNAVRMQQHSNLLKVKASSMSLLEEGS